MPPPINSPSSGMSQYPTGRLPPSTCLIHSLLQLSHLYIHAIGSESFNMNARKLCFVIAVLLWSHDLERPFEPTDLLEVEDQEAIVHQLRQRLIKRALDNAPTMLIA